MNDQPTDEQLAGRYFDEFHDPDHRWSGFAEDVIVARRSRYVRSVCGSPDAMRKIREMYPTAARDGFNAKVREHLGSLDGSPESAVALLAGIPRDRHAEYGGEPHA